MFLEGETPCETGKNIDYIDENDFTTFIDNFNPEHNKNNTNNQILKNPKWEGLYHEKEDIFYCNKKNGIDNFDCYPHNQLCKNCQMLNQAYHKLKKNYLLNSAGRVCTYRKGKMFCLGKFQRVFSEKDIDYLVDLTCNGKIQCEPCQRMQEHMEHYYGPELYKALLIRDQKLGY